MIAASSRWVRRMTYGLPREFWYLWLGTLINRVGIFVVPFLTLFLTRERGIEPAQAALVVSLFGLGSFVSQLAGGSIADRWGRRPTMLVSLFVTPVMLMILSQTTDYTALLIVTGLLGFFTDLYRPAASAIIADIIPPEDRFRAFSLRYWAINLGAAVGLFLGGVLASQNYMLLFIGDALTTLGFGIVTLLFVAETKPKNAPQTSTAHPSAEALLPGANHPRQHERAVFRLALMFTGLSLLTACIYMQHEVTMPLAMTASGISVAVYGAVAAINGVVIVLVTLPMNQYLSRYNRLNIMAGSALLIGAGFGLYAIVASVWGYAAGVVIWTVGELVASPIGPAILADLSPPHRRGFYQGLLGASFGLAAFIGPIVGGAIYQTLGQTTLWVVCLIAGTLAALGYIVVVKPLFERLTAPNALPNHAPTVEPVSIQG